MKDKIVSMVVGVIMAFIAMYPMFSNLKSTVKEVNIVITEANSSIKSIKYELINWQRDFNNLNNKIDSVKHELQLTVNNGLVKTENIINQELKYLNSKLDNLKIEIEQKIKQTIEPKNINNKIDSIKVKSIDDLKKWIKG